MKESTTARRNQSVFHSNISMTLPGNFIHVPTVLFATIFFDFTIIVISKWLRKLHEKNQNLSDPWKVLPGSFS